MKLRFLLPLLLFISVVILFFRGLNLHPNEVPSPLINKPLPSFSLPSLFNSKKQITPRDFKHHVTLLNVWATWCFACEEEHANLLALAHNEHIRFIGLNYKDENQDAMAFLKQYGNPYEEVASDQEGKAAIDFGVYGAPETFVIDKKGIIRYKQLGAITEEEWQTLLKPLINQLEQEDDV